MITIKQTGGFTKTTNLLNRWSTISTNKKIDQILNTYGQQGVAALKSATPKDTGLTADSWSYEIVHPEGKGYCKLIFKNSNVNKDWANVAILLQYGHATRNGGWVDGVDYINPAIQPIFDHIKNAAWSAIVDVQGIHKQSTEIIGEG